MNLESANPNFIAMIQGKKQRENVGKRNCKKYDCGSPALQCPAQNARNGLE
jgi:hypothetical protein